MDDPNPWSVDNLDIYLYYCCPQCDHKAKTKSLFVDHAHSAHPESKEVLIEPIVKLEDSEELVLKEDVKIKEEDFEDSFDTHLDDFDYDRGKLNSLIDQLIKQFL